jgi:hypothetical protein
MTTYIKMHKKVIGMKIFIKILFNHKIIIILKHIKINIHKKMSIIMEPKSNNPIPSMNINKHIKASNISQENHKLSDNKIILNSVLNHSIPILNILPNLEDNS